MIKFRTLIMPLRYLTSSESEEGSWECSAIFKIHSLQILICIHMSMRARERERERVVIEIDCYQVCCRGRSGRRRWWLKEEKWSGLHCPLRVRWKNCWGFGTMKKRKRNEVNVMVRSNDKHWRVDDKKWELGAVDVSTFLWFVISFSLLYELQREEVVKTATSNE